MQKLTSDSPFFQYQFMQLILECLDYRNIHLYHIKWRSSAYEYYDNIKRRNLLYFLLSARHYVTREKLFAILQTSLNVSIHSVEGSLRRLEIIIVFAEWNISKKTITKICSNEIRFFLKLSFNTYNDDEQLFSCNFNHCNSSIGHKK